MTGLLFVEKRSDLPRQLRTPPVSTGKECHDGPIRVITVNRTPIRQSIRGPGNIGMDSSSAIVTDLQTEC